MGLFKQEIKVGLSSEDLVIEKIELPKINHKNVDLVVAPDTVCVIGANTYYGNKGLYHLDAEVFGKKGEVYQALLFPLTREDYINVKFFGGKYYVCFSQFKSVKCEFSICGTANIKIGDYAKLGAKLNRTLTKEQLELEVVNNYREFIKNDIISYASNYINAETTEMDLKGALMSIARDCMLNEGAAFSAFNEIGLNLDYRGMSLHINQVGDTDELVKKVIEILNNESLKSISQKTANEEAEKFHQHEIEKINAEHTTTTNTNINKTINGSESKTTSKTQVSYCSHCGKKIPAGAQYCPSCGKKL